MTGSSSSNSPKVLTVGIASHVARIILLLVVPVPGISPWSYQYLCHPSGRTSTRHVTLVATSTRHVTLVTNDLLGAHLKNPTSMISRPRALDGSSPHHLPGHYHHHYHDHLHPNHHHHHHDSLKQGSTGTFPHV